MRNHSYLAPERHVCAEDLGCIGCGVDCCAGCVVQLESVPHCVACAMRLLGTRARVSEPYTVR